MKQIGIDIGGTKTEIVLIESAAQSSKIKYKILARERFPTERERGYKVYIEKLSKIIAAVIKTAKLNSSSISFLGAGLPGTVDPKTKRMIFGNTLMLAGMPLLDDIKKSTGIKSEMSCENDANCFAFAEARFGAGLKHAKDSSQLSSVGIILGTGVGGGIIIKGNIYSGRNGGAGEIGHTELYTSGLSCYCGRNGCVENYLSGPALESHFQRRLYSKYPHPLKASEIFEAYQKGDPIATAVVEQYQRDLAKFLGNLTNTFDPDFFVLGGGLSNQEDIYKNIKHFIQDHSFLNRSNMHSKNQKTDFIPSVYRNVLGDSAGVIGAAFLHLI